MGSSFFLKYESLINVHPFCCDVINRLVFEICYCNKTALRTKMAWCVRMVCVWL